MDDDLFHPNKIEAMLNVFLSEGGSNIRLVTSKRNLIDKNGNPLPDSFNLGPVDQSCIMDGKIFANHMLKYLKNTAGEPTTAMFKRSDLNEIFSFKNKRYRMCADMVTWIRLMIQGDIAFLVEPLSDFRLHDGQDQYSPKNIMFGAIELAHMALNARSIGLLLDNNDYAESIARCLNHFNYVNSQDLGLNEDIKNEFYKYFELVKEAASKIL
jgi:hypothetical protein